MQTSLAPLAPTGTTGNNTHAGVGAGLAAKVGVQFVVELAGATPTVTWKAQGSHDGVNWYDVLYVTDASDTASAAARTATSVGAQTEWLDLSASGARFYSQYRIVTTLNTNVTYRAELYTQR